MVEALLYSSYRDGRGPILFLPSSGIGASLAPYMVSALSNSLAGIWASVACLSLALPLAFCANGRASEE